MKLTVIDTIKLCSVLPASLRSRVFADLLTGMRA